MYFFIELASVIPYYSMSDLRLLVSGRSLYTYLNVMVVQTPLFFG